MIRTTYPSPAGPLVIIVENGSLVYCNWMCQQSNRKLQKIKNLYIQENESQDQDIIVATDTITQLEEYFSGKRRVFKLPLKFSGTDFQNQVYSRLIEIPYGGRISYKELAKRCGNEKAARAVANACGSNPLAIILGCHRVTGAGDKPGGYSGGLDKKLFLLELERKNTIKELP